MTDEERKEAERLAKNRWPGDNDIEVDVIHARARSAYVAGYAAAAEEKRSEVISSKPSSWDDLQAERARSAKLIESLRFYAEKKHIDFEVSPGEALGCDNEGDVARDAIAEYEASRD